MSVTILLCDKCQVIAVDVKMQWHLVFQTTYCQIWIYWLSNSKIAGGRLADDSSRHIDVPLSLPRIVQLDRRVRRNCQNYHVGGRIRTVPRTIHHPRTANSLSAFFHRLKLLLHARNEQQLNAAQSGSFQIDILDCNMSFCYYLLTFFVIHGTSRACFIKLFRIQN